MADGENLKLVITSSCCV